MKTSKAVKKIICLLIIIVTLTCIIFQVAAASPDTAYYSYRYNNYGKAIETATPFVARKVITGEQLGISAFNAPSDVFVGNDNKVYLLDSGNSRVVVLNENLKLDKILTPRQSQGTQIKFLDATGIFVDKSNKKILVADKKSKVYIFDENLVQTGEITAPQSNVLPDGFEYNPTKVVMDSAGIYYIISANCYSGALQYDENCNFLGFYGSEKVTLNFETQLNYFWKNILSQEQASNIKRAVPAEFVSFQIDKDDFVYTIRKGNDITKEQVKKLNALGNNIIKPKVFGDLNVTTLLCDIAVDKNKFISILDSSTGRILQYDGEGNMLYAFGGKGNQLGLSAEPVAIDAFGDDLLLLDKEMCALTVYEATDFSKNIRQAIMLCDDGRYEQAMLPWGEVLKEDNQFQLANRGIGKANDGMQNYKKAMNYYKTAGEKELYSQSFKEYRDALLRKNLPIILIVFIISLILIIALKSFFDKRKKNIYEIKINKYKQCFYCMLHPFNGYSNMKEKKNESFLVANILLISFFVVSIIVRQLTGFAFNENIVEKFNLFSSLISTIGLFVAFVVCNWAITTITDGKGKLKEIWCYCAYALLPFIIGMLVFVAFSNVLTVEEGAFLMIGKYVIYAWTIINMLIGLKELHMYSFAKTIWTTILTVIGMLIFVIICAILYNIFTQLFGFSDSIFTEIRMNRL